MPRLKTAPLRCSVNGPSPARRSPRAPPSNISNRVTRLASKDKKTPVPVKFNAPLAPRDKDKSKNSNPVQNNEILTDPIPEIFMQPIVLPLGNKASKSSDKVDKYCWVCHTECDIEQECEICPRIFHHMCLGPSNRFTVNGICPECRLKSVDGTDPDKALSIQTLQETLPLVLSRIINKVPTFRTWTSSERENRNLICVMDMSILEDKLNMGVTYTSTSSFLADVKWISHNCHIVYGAHNALTTKSKNLIRECRDELIDLEACTECYIRTHSLDHNFFVNLCKKRHTLVWAKIKGFPYWPAKVLKVIDGMASVRFFGSHDKGRVAASLCYLISERSPMEKEPKNLNYRNSTAELSFYLNLYKEKLKKEYQLAERKTIFTPGAEDCITKVAKKTPATRGSARGPKPKKQRGVGRGRRKAAASTSSSQSESRAEEEETPTSSRNDVPEEALTSSHNDKETPTLSRNDEGTQTTSHNDTEPEETPPSSQGRETDEVDDDDVEFIGETKGSPKHNFMQRLHLSSVEPQWFNVAPTTTAVHHCHHGAVITSAAVHPSYHRVEQQQQGLTADVEMDFCVDEEEEESVILDEHDEEKVSSVVMQRIIDKVGRELDPEPGELDLPGADSDQLNYDGLGSSDEVPYSNEEVYSFNNCVSASQTNVLPLCSMKYTSKIDAMFQSVVQEVTHDVMSLCNEGQLISSLQNENSVLKEAKRKEEERANEIKINTDLILKKFRENLELEKLKAVEDAEAQWKQDHKKDLELLKTKCELEKDAALDELRKSLDESQAKDLALAKSRHEKDSAELKLAHARELQDVALKAAVEARNEEKAWIDDIKRTIWCNRCLKPARFHCCWNTSYCSELCQHLEWELHFQICERRHEVGSDGKPARTMPITASNGLKAARMPATTTPHVIATGAMQNTMARTSMTIVRTASPKYILPQLQLPMIASIPPTTQLSVINSKKLPVASKSKSPTKTPTSSSLPSEAKKGP